MPSTNRQFETPELLAPAGQWDGLRAAVANGADAIYFGLGDFNARRRAANFTLEELPDVLAHLHSYNVRGYVTFNTLVFSDELARAQEYLRAIARAGADAIIVQDLGVATLAHRLCPALPLHASTQMTLCEPRGIERAGALGISRVILARELSLEQVAAIRRASDMPLEVFIHGALCISVSGQCLASQCLFGRSANRGQCDQPCRLPYEVLADGQLVDTGGRSYLLSPKDLAAYERIGQLVELGVSAFKIEGRLKGANYVAATVATYRAAIDAALQRRPFVIEPRQLEQLEQSFSRGFCTGFLDGSDHQQLVHGLYPNSRGSRAGAVLAVRGHRVHVRLDQGAISQGDGVVIDCSGQLVGGRVFAVQTLPRNELALELGPGSVDLSAIKSGQAVWKTDDPQLRREIEKSYSRQEVHRRVRIDVDVLAQAGAPLEVTWRDAQGHAVTVRSAAALEAARNSPLSAEMLRQQLGRLGETPFELGSLTLNGGDEQAGVMAPKSVLNELRRSAVEQLLALRRQAGQYVVSDADALADLRAEGAPATATAEGGCATETQTREMGAVAAASSSHANDMDAAKTTAEGGCATEEKTTAEYDCATAPTLSVLVRSMEQFQAALGESGVEIIYCDWADLDEVQRAVELAGAAGRVAAPATLRIYRPGEEHLLERLAAMNPPAVLVRNLTALDYFARAADGTSRGAGGTGFLACADTASNGCAARTSTPRLIGDFSLNVANELTGSVLAAWGLERLTAAYDLDDEQLLAMLAHVPAGRLEIVRRNHVPMFHMQHCLFAARLSQGHDARSCGQPCRRHTLALRDRIGAVHAVTTDAACRNTIFAERLGERNDLATLRPRGLRHFRLEFLHEDAAAVRRIISAAMQEMVEKNSR